MSVLTNLIIKTITRVIKDVTKLELSIDDIIDKFKEACPPKDELLKIVQQKNQLQSALQNVVDAFNTIQSTVNVTEATISTVTTAINIIKAIPVPSSIPPGIGIPINVITLLADSLDTLSNILKRAEGAVSIIPSASQSIVDASNTVITRLQTLDVLINGCIENLSDGMTQAEKNELISEVNNAAATSGDFSNLGLNLVNDKELENRLLPTSNDPFLYQKTGFPSADWKLLIEYNQDNEFSFPQRRIKAVNINESPSNIYRGVVVYNIQGKKWSYSSSVKVLIDETKFVIEQLDNNWWANNNTNFDLSSISTSGGTVGSQNISTDAISIGTVNLPPQPVNIPNNLKQIKLPVEDNTTEFGVIETTRDKQKFKFTANSGPNGEFKAILSLSKQGEVALPRIITLKPKKEVKEKTVEIEEKGKYTIAIVIQDQKDILPESGASVSLVPE
jgi:hypothetical protein